MTVATAPSPTTERARAFVARHLDEAAALGRDAGELVGDPAAVAARLRTGLEDLADPEYREGMAFVAPGIGPILGVRTPLLRAVGQGLRAATRRDSTDTVLDVAEVLVRADLLELRWLGFGLLRRTVRANPERSWQLIRRAAADADNWVTVDSLAGVVATGVLAEPYRWAELEQLVYSPSRWERRLVGSSIAVMPSTDRTRGREPSVAARALPILRDLIGDAEPDVQKALSWALRSMSVVDEAATVAFLEAEARTAVKTADGHRAWVIRDSLEKLPEATAAPLRDTVAGIRKRPHSPSTSRAAETAASFTSLGVAVPPAERQIVERT